MAVFLLKESAASIFTLNWADKRPILKKADNINVFFIMQKDKTPRKNLGVLK